jgi:GGDEF domain-containing protein
MGDGGAAAVAAIIANAIKASGTLVRIEPDQFAQILRRVEQPMVIYAEGGLISTNHQYLTSYKGFAFYTKARQEIELPKGCEVIITKKIWIPG